MELVEKWILVLADHILMKFCCKNSPAINFDEAMYENTLFQIGNLKNFNWTLKRIGNFNKLETKRPLSSKFLFEIE